MLVKLLVASAMFFSGSAFAGIQCEAFLGAGKTLIVSADAEDTKVQILTFDKITYTQLFQTEWSESTHAGFISGKGLSLEYDNVYFCVKNAKLIVDLGQEETLYKVHFSACHVDGIHDETCGVL